MADCKHRGTMILTPTEDRDFEYIPWCFYLEKEIKLCSEDCPYKYRPVNYE